MARARLVKPGFFKNEDLCSLPYVVRILYEGLWCLADRLGKLEDRPKRIKIEVLPYDDEDVNELLATLAAQGFIIRYEVNGQRFIKIPKFLKHQNPHHNEAISTLPEPDSPMEDVVSPMDDALLAKSPLNLEPCTLEPCNLDGSSSSPDGDDGDFSKNFALKLEQKPAHFSAARRFPEFWAVRWRSDGKAAAKKSFAKFATTDRMADLIIAAAIRDKPGYESRADKTKRPHMSTWLNQQRFLDDEPATPELSGRVLNETERAALSLMRDTQEGL